MFVSFSNFSNGNAEIESAVELLEEPAISLHFQKSYNIQTQTTMATVDSMWEHREVRFDILLT